MFTFIYICNQKNMLVNLVSAAILGIHASPVRIEVYLSKGIRFSLVGLPDNAVKESHERIISALQVNGMDVPRKQIIINMAPADLRKEGTSYDLPLSVGMMAGGEYIPVSSLENSLFIGELSLDGRLQRVRGILPVAIMAKEMGIKRLILPAGNAEEAAVVDGLEVYGMENLGDVAGFLNGLLHIEPVKSCNIEIKQTVGKYDVDFSDVKGHELVKRAVEVACAGGHNMIMIGPPGAGKTMIAKCIPGILPPMSLQESLETTKVHSVAGKTDSTLSLVRERPFRSPHHSISAVALIGGGNKPQPGEISLAHNGVLFLDELPEFQRHVLEVLRQPLEDRRILVSRADYNVEYPAGFMLVASMNPCPCGYYNHPVKVCVCAPGQVHKYLNRISGPLMDRIDIQVEIVPVTFEKMSEKHLAEDSSSIRKRVIEARKKQEVRFREQPGTFCNAQMSARLLRKYAQPEASAMLLLKAAMNSNKLSARAYDRILKVSRTIADLDNSEKIEAYHLAEAVQYRLLDKDSW